jgi:hypothetical protein
MVLVDVDDPGNKKTLTMWTIEIMQETRDTVVLLQNNRHPVD